MQIRINNTLVPAGKNFSARLEHVSAIFEQEILTGQYTFPFEIPISRELEYATSHLNHPKRLIDDPYTDLEFDCDVIDGGIQRYSGKIRFTGRNSRSMRAELTLGTSRLYDWMKTTRLRDLDLGTVTLNGDTVQKFVIFEFTEPISGTANTGNFGIGFTDYNTVPWNTNMATTIADFVTDYNGSSWAAIDDVTASQPASNQLKFTANNVGGMQPFDYSNSIADATLPTYLGDPWTVAVDSHFNYVGYQQDIASAVVDMNDNFDDGNDRFCVFPIIKNPNFIDEEVDLLSGQYCGYINYTDPASATMSPPYNTTDWPWRYHLTPCPVLFEVLKAAFADQGYTYDDEFSKESYYEYIIMYNNRAIDQPYSLTTSDDTINIWQGVVNINEHVPDITVLELVEAIKKWQNLSSLADDRELTFTLFRNDAVVDNYNINNDANRVVWHDYEDTDADTEEWDLPAPNGMTLSFAPDSDDDLYDEVIKDREPYTEGSSVASYSNLPNIGVTDQVRLVRDQNQYYRWNGASWEFHSELIDDYVHEEGDLKIGTSVGLLPMIRDTDSVDQIYTPRNWFIPHVKQVGDHQRNNGDFEPSGKYSLRLMYWRHSVALAGPPYGYWLANNHYLDPYSSHDPFANSAHWYGTYGRFAMDWQAWYNLQKFGKKVYLDFLIPFAVQVAVNPLKWIWTRGKRILPTKVIIPLPFSHRVRVEGWQKNNS